MEKNEKTILSVKNLSVSFKSHGNNVNIIRGISVDIKAGETIGIVGESGSGKSVFTKTFTGMLDANGSLSGGSICLHGIDLSADAHKQAKVNAIFRGKRQVVEDKIEEAQTIIAHLKGEGKGATDLSITTLESLNKLTSKEKEDKITTLTAKIKNAEKKIALIETKRLKKIAKLDAADDKRQVLNHLIELNRKDKIISLGETAKKKLLDSKKDDAALKIETINSSVASKLKKLEAKDKVAANKGKELPSTLRPANIYLKEKRRFFSYFNKKAALAERLFAKKIATEDHVTLSQLRNNKEWSLIRGKHIATIFQDPMTSLNPLFSIGYQISEVLILHHNYTKKEAKAEAIELLRKVHIPEPEKRYDEYPFQYSGGMRQRVVIAIALACRPDILICDEPTTALDVTVQAQILELIKELQKEFHLTIIFITHDLGVVAGVADRVIVMYGGEIVELGTVEDVFYQPAHPYTWALLSSLPQLAMENEPLTYIKGNPPSFTEEIVGDAFAPRSNYGMPIDKIAEAPMFKISETHFAKTWLLDPRAPKVEKPKIIQHMATRMAQAASELHEQVDDEPTLVSSKAEKVVKEATPLKKQATEKKVKEVKDGNKAN